MSQGSYSFARTLTAKRARQDAREYTRAFSHGTIPLMAEAAPREKFSLVVEQLPNFGPWAIAYTADGGLKELPVFEAYSFIKIPGVKCIRRRVISFRG